MEMSTLLLKFIDLVQIEKLESFCCGPWCLVQFYNTRAHVYNKLNPIEKSFLVLVYSLAIENTFS